MRNVNVLKKHYFSGKMRHPGDTPYQVNDAQFLLLNKAGVIEASDNQRVCKIPVPETAAAAACAKPESASCLSQPPEKRRRYKRRDMEPES